MKKKSRCRVVLLHLVVTWLTYNVSLFFVLWNTSTCFDRTEHSALIAMGLITLGMSVVQYDIWKARHDIAGKTRTKIPEKENQAGEEHY